MIAFDIWLRKKLSESFSVNRMLGKTFLGEFESFVTCSLKSLFHKILRLNSQSSLLLLQNRLFIGSRTFFNCTFWQLDSVDVWFIVCFFFSFLLFIRFINERIFLKSHSADKEINISFFMCWNSCFRENPPNDVVIAPRYVCYGALDKHFFMLLIKQHERMFCFSKENGKKESHRHDVT